MKIIDKVEKGNTKRNHCTPHQRVSVLVSMRASINRRSLFFQAKFQALKTFHSFILKYVLWPLCRVQTAYKVRACLDRSMSGWHFFQGSKRENFPPQKQKTCGGVYINTRPHACNSLRLYLHISAMQTAHDHIFTF